MKIVKTFKRLLYNLPNSVIRNLKLTYDLIVQTIYEFADDKAVKMSAALSFYMIFSLSPLLIIVIAVVGFIFGEDAARGELVQQIGGLFGRENAEVIQSVVQNLSAPSSGVIATIISGGVIIFASAGIFVELKESLNIIWGVEPKPAGIWGFLRNRAKSFVMVLFIMLLLFASIIATTALSTINSFLEGNLNTYIPGWQYLNYFLSYIIMTVLFAIVYKFLPDVSIKWKYVWFGAFITSLLFSLGKFLIGLYMTHTSYQSIFGAAGSLVVFMAWVYYSSFIFFFGAEFTQVYRNKFAKTPLRPNKYSVKIEKVTKLISDAVGEISESNEKNPG